MDDGRVGTGRLKAGEGRVSGGEGQRAARAGFVGIIANPASGKDIRRLVSRATTVNNHEKVSIVQRLLAALDANGVSRVEIMPDPFGIGRRALDGLRDRPNLSEACSLIDMVVKGGAEDSACAARYLSQSGAGCIVVLGGDGTCRVVSKACGQTPLLAISTGTNNVVPSFVEGTVAGAAAAYVARLLEDQRYEVCRRHKRLAVIVNGEAVDQALVEVALVTGGFVGARAIWDASRLRQVFVARAQPATIGLSSTVGMVRPVDPHEPRGAVAAFSCDGTRVMAPLAPGAFTTVGIRDLDDLEPGVSYPVDGARPGVLGLDGEREIVLHAGDRAEVRLGLDGPWIVDVSKALARAVAAGEFVRSA
jgi:predicted polyphosphate/ATP-dependent NAD kinase